MRSTLTRIVVATALVLSGTIALVAVPVAPVAAAGGGVVDLGSAVPATFTVTPGVEQATVRGGPIRSPLTLADATTLERVITLYTDDLGQLTFQYVPDDFLVFDPQLGVLPTTAGSTLPPGSYVVVSEGVPGEPFAGPVEASDPFDVLSVDDHPDPSLYDGQTLPSVPVDLAGAVKAGHTDEEGYGYLETRDGTLLSVNVRLPDPAVYGPGPYPTVIQYSGYAPSRPGTPSGADAGGQIAGALGFAYVGVNIRGSGCSGGVFDAFNAAQAADGYDVVETVARQPWVKNGKVGMIGISYSGITQLYVAATNPPSLAGITPLSVIEDPWYQQWPGGIYNHGFTQQWLASRDDEAAGGAQWVQDRISGGDTTCGTNLVIRSQNIPFEDFAKSLTTRPLAANDRNLSQLVRQIDVPVFLAGAWQDEQTGPQFAAMLDDFVSVPPGESKFTLYNGHHPDGLSPLVMTRWFEFLSLYVDQTIPKVNPLIRLGAPSVFEGIFGVPNLSFEPNRFYKPNGTTLYPDYPSTLAAYQSEPQVRVLFEVGASPDFLPDYPMAHRQRFEMTFPSWPPADASARTFYFGPDGTLTEDPAAATGADRYEFDPTVLSTRYFKGGDHGAVNVVNDWKVTPDGNGVAYETPPLDQDLIVAGSGHVNLWIRSTGTDVPLEAVLSEVYADPNPDDAVPPEEVRVQHGLLRAGFRTLDPDRTSGTAVDHLFYADDYQPLTPGEWVNVQVPIYAVSHPFRAGSKLRIEINTPGGDNALWDYESSDYGATTHDVGWGTGLPSSVVLPVLPAGDPTRQIPAQFEGQENHPPCDSLRGQPCRDYKQLVNDTVETTPGAPQIDSVTPGHLSVDVSWSPPASDGGSAITGYTVTATPGGGTCSWTSGPLSCTVSGLDGGVAHTFTVTATNGLGDGDPSPASNPLVPFDGSGFHPVTPFRALDSRPGGDNVGFVGPIGPGATQELTVAGVGDVPADATAVVLNVTATEGTDASYLTVFPGGTTPPTTANLLFAPGETVPNHVTVGVGANGKVAFFNQLGNVQVTADVVGYYADYPSSPGEPGDAFFSPSPTRVLDSREPGAGPWTGAPLGAGETRDLVVTGIGSEPVPADATAVVMNVTVTGGTEASYLQAFPAGATQPETANVLFGPGQTVPNLVTVGIGPGGAVSLFNQLGNVHVVADVVGYYAPVGGGGTFGLFHPVAPERLLDSRDAGAAPWDGTPIPANGNRSLTVAGAGTVPADANGLVANVTVTGGSQGSYLSVSPTPGAVPAGTANLLFGPGQTVPNGVTSGLGAGQIDLFNSLGSVHAIVDANGYFAAH